MVVGDRCDHGNTNTQHGQDRRGHKPVQEPHTRVELPLLGGHPNAHFRTSEGVIALGSFFSPALLVNDCEKTADRALSRGSSDGVMPAGKTNGSKFMSRAGLVSSLSTESRVRVPTSTCSRPSGHGTLASSVRSPGCPRLMIKCHCNGW